MRVLVTGGAGYVGRHVALELFQAGHTPELLDNLQNAGPEHVRELEELLQEPVRLHLIDIVEDRAALRRLFRHTAFDAVVHLAALKSVPESFQSPVAYYQTNVAGTLNVLEAMAQGGCRKLIFSSSACVYGTASGGGAPLLEEALWPGRCTPSSPYSLSKDVAERLLRGLPEDVAVCSLRYFNPLGAHPSGRLGDAGGANVMAHLLAATENSQPFAVHGTNYNTVDGTCIRDYVHVSDVARAHVCVLEQLRPRHKESLNVGLGKGTSVRQLVRAMEGATGRPMAVADGPRRKGDTPVSVADPSALVQGYGWEPRYNISDMCRHAVAAHRLRPAAPNCEESSRAPGAT